MGDTKGYSSTNAAESVGERPGTQPPDTGEHVTRPVQTSAGPGARIAEKTAEAIGERAGDAYADATTDEAQQWSRNAVRHGASRDGSLDPPFDQQTFVTVIAAFALGYVTALLIHRSSS